MDIGGGLFVVGDSSVDHGILNHLLEPYGIAFSSIVSEGSGHTTTAFVNHPLTRGLQSIGVDYQRRIGSILPPAIDLTVDDGADQALACRDGSNGSGNVVVVSDSTIFSDVDARGDRYLTFGNNLTLLHNILTYTTGVGTYGAGTNVPVELSHFSAE